MRAASGYQGRMETSPPVVRDNVEHGRFEIDLGNGEYAFAAYHLLPGVRGDLLQKLGRHDDARAAFTAAAELAGNRRERDLMLRRAAEAADATKI